MPGVYRPTWSALVSAMSDQVVAQLSQQGLPPLTPRLDGSPGRIELGPQFVAEQGSPPRIIMIPKNFPFEAQSWDAVGPAFNARSNPDWDPRPLGTQWKTFEVQCWGCDFSPDGHGGFTATPDPALDYDGAQILCEMVWQAAHALAAGQWQTHKGTVDEEKLIRFGHVIVFDLELSTPAPDFTLPFAPPGTVAKTITKITINGNAPVPP